MKNETTASAAPAPAPIAAELSSFGTQLGEGLPYAALYLTRVAKKPQLVRAA